MEGTNPPITDEEKAKKRTKIIQTVIALGVPFLMLTAFFVYAGFSYKPPQSDIIALDQNVNQNQNSSELTNTNSNNVSKSTYLSRSTTASLPACEVLNVPATSGMQLSTSSPGLKESTTDHYYKIHGNTDWDLREQMKQCGPKADGESFDAVTYYYINWQYLYDYKADGKCNVMNLAVGVKVNFYYPSWEEKDSGAKSVVDKWSRYMTNLITHEEGHRQRAIDGAAKVLDKLNSLSDYPDCESLENGANAEGTAVMNQLEADQKSYDDDTGHGATQGAVFP